MSGRSAGKQEGFLSNQINYFAQMLASPDRSSAHFPLEDVPASKETLKYGGFLQRNCIFVVPIHFHQETDIGYVYTTQVAEYPYPMN